MAIYNGRILMRKGLEADFDASKLMSGEWALSTDKGIIRICLEAGTVIRMATYEAFEEDMKQIEAILLECKTIEEAVERINTELSTKVNAVAEYVGQAKTYRDEALQYRNEAEAFKNQAGEIAGIDIATNEKAGIVKPDGETLEVDSDGTMRVIGGGVSDYSELENKPSINGTELNGNKTLNDLGIASATELEKTNTKVDTIIEKADLGIKETASGEEIHLIDSAEGKAVEFALYGKAKQDTTSGKNLIPFPYYDKTKTLNGISWTDNGDGSITANGTADATNSFVFNHRIDNTMILGAGEYKLSGCPKGGSNTTYRLAVGRTSSTGSFETVARDFGEGATFTLTEDTDIFVGIDIVSGATVNNLVVRPMVSLASITDNTWEQPTNGATPRPDYPQEIEVSGESYNLLENTATSQTINGIEFVVNEDGSVTANGTATALATLPLLTLNNDDFVDGEKYILSGCSGGSNVQPYTYLLDLSNYVFIGNGEKEFIFDKSLTYKASISVWQGVKVENLTFYPMIRKASVKNDRYMPYGKGSVEVISSNEDNTKTTTATIPTENGLAGIKVSSGGNYTDQNGQQWICDEIVKYADGSGAYIQRVGKVEFPKETANYAVNSAVEGIEPFFVLSMDYFKKNVSATKLKTASTHFQYGNPYNEQGEILCAYVFGSGGIRFRINGITTVEALATWLQTNSPQVLYELYEPITTPLTAEELAEISTFYPVTNISNDFDCGMKVKYNADSKNYIDKQLAEMERAREQAMMSMFLLLPEETQATMIENDVNNLLTESEN